ncbi:MAG: hypothetical protein NTW87_09845 [Planctomycetota bacterium]|nr:hypothetical protein [Planctomycetota bacterium]
MRMTDGAKLISDAILQALAELSEEHGCSMEDAFYALAGRRNQWATGERSRWGRLPEDYDPEGDPAHPAKGWKPESTE